MSERETLQIIIHHLGQPKRAKLCGENILQGEAMGAIEDLIEGHDGGTTSRAELKEILAGSYMCAVGNRLKHQNLKTSGFVLASILKDAERKRLYVLHSGT